MNAPTITPTAASTRYVDRDTLFEVERFLIREARMLDEERFREWWQTQLTEDIHYVLPVREIRMRANRQPIGSNPGAFVFNDNHQMLDMRIRRLETGLVWMEDPQNYIRRFISNIDAAWADVDGEVDAWSNFIVYRNRRQRDETVVWGTKQCRLRKVDGQWKLAGRTILVDQRVVLDKNLYFFL